MAIRTQMVYEARDRTDRIAALLLRIALIDRLDPLLGFDEAGARFFELFRKAGFLQLVERAFLFHSVVDDLDGVD